MFAQTHMHVRILNLIVCMLVSILKASDRRTLRCIAVIRGVFVYLFFFLRGCVREKCPES